LFSLFDAEGVNPPTSRTRAVQSARKSATPDVSLSPILSRDARVLFLDVETTGLSWFYDEITIIGWAIDGAYKVLVKGEDPVPLLQDLASATVLVTFNGTLFDLRFLRKTFGELVLPGIHVDLRYLSRRVGLAGGQKSIERELQIDFRSDLEGVDGAAAVLLWHDYLRGSLAALQKLVLYNRSDVLGMAAILDIVMARLNLQRDFWLQPQAFEEIARRIFGQPAPMISGRALKPGVTFRSFASIFSATPAEDARIVGIDLTGSEKRGSGWCVLDGAIAETLTVHTDEEMVGRIIALKPDLVSIDSPLSLPFGRTVVTDDDPGRQQYGIMRKCERELKRRGVNVYPALLPSMQGLTRRGMLLAARIRREGRWSYRSYAARSGRSRRRSERSSMTANRDSRPAYVAAVARPGSLREVSPKDVRLTRDAPCLRVKGDRSMPGVDIMREKRSACPEAKATELKLNLSTFEEYAEIYIRERWLT
jgi:uncharacterized protein YprB with RNaseH-like and TPR domain/predicted nuclease with RNAse H fold